MAADFHCLIHGLVIASEVELPLARIGARPADVTYRVALSTNLPPPTHSRSDDPEWAVDHWIEDRLAVEFPERATFEVRRSEVVLASDAADDPDLVTHLFLDHVLPRVISLRGDLMLHAAGAVGPSGRAHLLLGMTGTGKSTTVAALVSNGWPLLGDDGIRVIQVADHFDALPGGSGIRLLPDSAAAVMPTVPPGRPVSAGNPKRRFPTRGGTLRTAKHSAPIAGLYLLTHTTKRDPFVEQLGFAEALGTISEHGFHLADEPESVTRQAFERASELAATAQAWRLSVPSDLNVLYATIKLIGELDRESTPSGIPTRLNSSSANTDNQKNTDKHR